MTTSPAVAPFLIWRRNHWHHAQAVPHFHYCVMVMGLAPSVFVKIAKAAIVRHYFLDAANGSQHASGPPKR
jgi:hypothetical protein